MSESSKIPAVPPGSKAAGRALWRSILENYELETHELTLLRQACAVADTCAALQVVIDRDGVLIENRFREPVAHPATVELRQQRIVLTRLVVALRVPLGDQEQQHGARPQRRGARGVYMIQGGAS